MDNKKEKLLENLLKVGVENEVIEFKVNNYTHEEIGKRISALSNSANLVNAKNAYIVFGVEDKTRNIVGTTFRPDETKVGGNEQLKFWLARHLSPSIDFQFVELDYKNQNIVILEIPPAIDQPVKYNNIAYIRIGSATPKLSDFPDKERKIWNNINKNSFEKNISIESLPLSEVLDYMDYSSYFSLTKQKTPTETIGFLEKMGQHNLVKKVFSDSYDITNLGAILFAKNLDNFPSVKRKAVRVVQYDGDSRVKRIKENLYNSGYAVIFKDLLNYINDKLPSNEEISRSFRKEIKMYPEVAIREFVANALIHQDLSISGAGPIVEIFDNRLEIINPGEPLIDTSRFIDHPPISRNEDLASFMRQIGVCEEGGTGVDRALIEMSIFQLPAPSFETYDGFTKVTLYAYKELSEMSSDDKVRACFQHCVLKHIESKRMTNASLRERLGIPKTNYPAASKIIKDTIEKGLIKESETRNEYIPIWA